MNRNNSIDTLRTIATFLVILVHISGGYVFNSKDNLTLDSSFWFANIVDSLSRICVPLFVLISGMFLLGRNETFKESYQKRSIRIVIPLVFWSVIYVLYRIAIMYFIENTIDLKLLVSSIIINGPFYHMWYLLMIVSIYLITPIINIVIPQITRKTLWGVAILLLVFGMFNHSYNNYLNNKVFFLLWFVNYLGFFILGYLIKVDNRKFSFGALTLIYILSSLLIAFLTHYTIKLYDSVYFYGYVTPFVIIGSLSFFKIFHQLELNRNIFSKISHLTLGIYLIHAGVLDVIDLTLKHSNINYLNNAIIGIPIKFSAVLFFSLITVWVMSKIKFVRKVI